MKTLRKLRRGFIVLAAAVLAFLLSPPGSRVVLPGVEGIPEVKENPRGRQQYEWMRLHDPNTGAIPPEIRRRELAFARGLPTKTTLFKSGDTGDSAQITWIRRGPANIGGRTRALAVDIGNPSTLVAGAVSGGMWKSTDGGLTWRQTTTADQLHSVTCVVQDTRPGRRNIWYYGTGELTGNSATGGGSAIYRGDGIFKSTDGGDTWAQLASTVSGSPQAFTSMFQYVWNIVLDSSSTVDEVYAATIGGLLRSTNGGTSWSVVLGGSGNNNSRYTDVAITPSGVLYATLSEATLNGGSGAVSQGIWRSTDGLVWTDIRPTSPAWPTSFKRIVIGIAPTNERAVYFLGETPGFGKTVDYGGSTESNSFWRYTYFSSDGRGTGGRWENRSASLPGYGAPVGDFVSQGSYNLVVKVSPLNDSLVFIGGTNIYRSYDGFRTTGSTDWIGGYALANDISQYPSHHVDQHVLVFSPDNPVVLLNGNDGGVFKTLDCTQSQVDWISLNNNYLTTQFYTLAIDHGTALNPLIVGGTQDNGTLLTVSSDASVGWADLLGGDGAFCAVADGRTSYYVSAQEGQTYRLILSSGGGFLNYARVDPAGGADYLFINPFVLDPSNNAVMYLAGGGSLWKNSDLTAIPLRTVSSSADDPTSVNWTNMTGSGVNGDVITAFGVSRLGPPSRLYFGTASGKIYRLDNAISAVATTPPIGISSDKGLPAGYVSCLAVDPLNGNRVIAVFSNYGIPSVFLTRDGGSSWTDVSGNLEQNRDGSGAGPSVRWAAIQRYGGGPNYFLGTSTGLYSTETLQGSNTVWVQEGAQTIGNVVVDMIDVRSSDGLVVVGTHGQGIFSGDAPAVGPSPEDIPTTTVLQQNYPNPFNPYTRIQFALAEPAHVTLCVYSVSGQKVATLVEEQRPAGYQSDIVWTPRERASGVYLCELRAGGFKQVVKMLYLK
jgi:hypothetical protein